MQHPGFGEAAVVRIPDARRGEVPAAAFEPTAGATVAEDELIQWLKDRLLANQMPVIVRRLEALPRNASMKVALDQFRTLLAAD